jgi:hypothetical protein
MPVYGKGVLGILNESPVPLILLSLEPSMPNNVTETALMVLAESCTVAVCPAVALKVTFAACPGADVVSVTGDPPMEVVTVSSGGTGGTLYSCNVTVPDVCKVFMNIV